MAGIGPHLVNTMAGKRGTPKYQVIKDALLSWITEGRIIPGDKLPVEDELAETFVVSRQTVRQAVGELVTEGILQRKQGNGTYFQGMPMPAPVQEKINPSRHIIGIVTTYISDYIFPSIIRGIEERLSADGYSPLLFSTQNDSLTERRALKTILARGVEGVIVEPTKSAIPNYNADLYKELKQSCIPVVLLHARYDDLHAPVIGMDDLHGAVLATRHLLERGHKRIGAIMKIDDKQGVPRLEGFLKAGGTFSHELISFYTTESRYRVSEHYVERLTQMAPVDRPTALFCYNDAIATDIIVKLRERGLSIPEDISIVGFDDSQLATIGYPPLTTVAHPKSLMGIRAADTILQLIDQSGLAVQEIADFLYTPSLIVRDSTRFLHETQEVLLLEKSRFK